ncbi:MAG: redoxin family protein [Planctomycetota bacterium]
MFQNERYFLIAVSAFVLSVSTTLCPLINLQGQEVSDSEADSEVTLNLTITDEEGKPIPGASAEVMKWTGEYESIGALAKTDTSGKAELKFPFADNFFYLQFHAPGYAASVRGLPQVASGAEESLQLKLSRPVQSWVLVNAGGKPLVGAEISVLKVVDVNGITAHLTFKTGPQVGFKMSASDESGRLELPELPLGSKVSFTITHPEWQSHKFTDVIAKAGSLGNANLQSGVPVVVKLVTEDSTALEDVEGKRADVIMFPNPGGSNHPTTVRHAFPVRKGEVRMTGYATEYSELRFTLKDYFTFPTLMNYPYSPNAKLDLTGAEEAVFELKIFRKQKARGRIVDQNGKGISGAYVSANVLVGKDKAEAKNESENGEDENSDASKSKNPIDDFVRNSMSAGGGETDKDGYYEIEVTPGVVQFEVIHSGVFSSPVVSEYEWSGNIEDRLPDKVMLPIPELKGKVVDADGKPVIGSIVIMRHHGRGDADPVGTTSADGSFSLSMSRIPYSTTASGLETEVYVLAMHPATGRAGVTKIDVTDSSATAGIQVEITDKSAEWPLKALGPAPKALQEMRDSFSGRAEQLREKFSLGTAGKIPPAMHEGTWLNTDAKSLLDFRGKYVLLDFWFIGCGPCLRDMPSVKIAHQEFSRLGFAVVSVNVTGQNVDDVRTFARDHGMNYPIVVDGADEAILNAYKKLGVSGFPSYILLGPDGRILHNDQLTFGTSLRLSKLELIFQAIRSRLEK